jgi:hypothetical protein
MRCFITLSHRWAAGAPTASVCLVVESARANLSRTAMTQLSPTKARPSWSVAPAASRCACSASSPIPASAASIWRATCARAAMVCKPWPCRRSAGRENQRRRMGPRAMRLRSMRRPRVSSARYSTPLGRTFWPPGRRSARAMLPRSAKASPSKSSRWSARASEISIAWSRKPYVARGLRQSRMDCQPGRAACLGGWSAEHDPEKACPA